MEPPVRIIVGRAGDQTECFEAGEAITQGAGIAASHGAAEFIEAPWSVEQRGDDVQHPLLLQDANAARSRLSRKVQRGTVGWAGGHAWRLAPVTEATRITAYTGFMG